MGSPEINVRERRVLSPWTLPHAVDYGRLHHRISSSPTSRAAAYEQRLVNVQLPPFVTLAAVSVTSWIYFLLPSEASRFKNRWVSVFFLGSQSEFVCSCLAQYFTGVCLCIFLLSYPIHMGIYSNFYSFMSKMFPLWKFVKHIWTVVLHIIQNVVLFYINR